jgi:hypothetical protein
MPHVLNYSQAIMRQTKCTRRPAKFGTRSQNLQNQSAGLRHRDRRCHLLRNTQSHTTHTTAGLRTTQQVTSTAAQRSMMVLALPYSIPLCVNIWLA